MIKKLTWTIIIISPFVFEGIIKLLGGGDSAFNSTAALYYWGEFFDQFKSLIGNSESFALGEFVGYLILACIWTAPFWYAWKGTFIVGWVPFVGFILRMLLLLILFIVPLFTSDMIGAYFAIIISIIALLGLWIKS
ncbi:MAG: hypothetical protein TYPL_0230 [Candidatus Tyloplasma litorale]|nr:MAG: hypothetical protein TYPL_0230 [Mycoplasmatales bacterium]